MAILAEYEQRDREGKSALVASRHWMVHDVSYDYEGAVAAGSDHALARAGLELHDSS